MRGAVNPEPPRGGTPHEVPSRYQSQRRPLPSEPQEDYSRYPPSDPQKHFTSEEELYGQIANDEKLIARLSPETALRDLRKLVEVDDE